MMAMEGAEGRQAVERTEFNYRYFVGRLALAG